MKISTRGKNAVKIMLDLANHNDGSPVKLKDIAQRQNVSLKYMEQIVSLLQRNALIKSVKGASGGYILKYPTESYTIKQILTATEGDLSPVDCVSDGGASCDNMPFCVYYRVWEKLNTAISDALDGITLADLLDWQEEMLADGHYVI